MFCLALHVGWGCMVSTCSKRLLRSPMRLPHLHKHNDINRIYMACLIKTLFYPRKHKPRKQQQSLFRFKIPLWIHQITSNATVTFLDFAGSPATASYDVTTEWSHFPQLFSLVILQDGMTSCHSRRIRKNYGIVFATFRYRSVLWKWVNYRQNFGPIPLENGLILSSPLTV